MADQLAVFHATNLPHHPANPDHMGDILPWPQIGGQAVMPMSGRFMVQTAAGLTGPHIDGFLLVDPAGHPYWRPSIEPG